MLPNRLNLGCGFKRRKGFINADCDSSVRPDVIMDMNKRFPFPDNYFDEIYADSILEHFTDVCKILKEMWRVSKDKAKINIIVPHYTSFNAWTNPDHKHAFTEKTFDFLDGEKQNRYPIPKNLRFKVRELKIIKTNIGRFVPDRFVFFLAHHIGNLIDIMVFELEVIKV